MKVVTRFAPSPTGHLHIGGARTAIFCWLLARHNNGEFRLRIEDTDTERSKQEYTDSILASMKWLGLDYDNDLVYQNQRQDIYTMYVNQLLESGHAYYCNCSVEEVDAMREVARAKGEKPKYNGRCQTLNLTSANASVVRFKTPTSGKIVFKDMVKGSITVDVSELDDMVLRRTDGMVTYNMAVVVDDHEMGVTHVVRGDDHVSNTPKQILLYEALGFGLPTFGHVPMILGADKQKLSKRHGARATIEYEKDGLLPQALVNYLVRLGWSHGDQEIFSLQELVSLFNGENLSVSPSAFDPDKLQWLNAYYLKGTDTDSLIDLVRPFLEALGHTINHDILNILLPVYKERAQNLVDLATQIAPYFLDAQNLSIDDKAQKALNEDGKTQLRNLLPLFKDNAFSEASLEACINGYVEQQDIKFKAVGTPLRAALIGISGGPSVHIILYALGKEESIKRLELAVG